MARKQNWAWIAVVAAGLFGVGVNSLVRADDAAPAEKKDAPRSQPSPAEISQWVKDLDSDTFATRQTAAEMLVQTGKPVIYAVAEASTGKSLEVTMQAVNILRRLSQATDQPTRDAAKDALERLAKTDSAAAAPAKEALATPPAPANQQGIVRRFGRIGGGIQIMPGGPIQIVPGGAIPLGGAIPAGGVQIFRIQANAIGGNGNRSIDVNENGKQTHITEDQNGIEVKVTEKVNGQDKTDTYKAKDVAELKNKFPEAAKLYDKYMNGQGGGNIQIQAQAVPIQIGGIPGGILPPGFAPAAPNTDATKQASQQIAEAQKRIAEATENLKKNPGAPPSAEDMKRALDQLDEARKELEGARGKLGS